MEQLFWVGVTAVLALVSSVVSLVLTVRAGSPLELKTKVRALDNDLTDLNDRVEHWRGRDAVRRMRAGQQLQPEMPAIPQRGTAEYKQWLRSRAANGGNT